MSTTTTESTDAWRFELADGTVPVTSLLDSQPAPKRGDTGDFEVLLASDGRGDHVERYESLVAYADYAGQYELHDVDGPEFSYTEKHRDSAPGGSLVVAIHPADWDTTGRGIWGLIDEVSDDAADPESTATITMSVVYLAPLSQYPTRSTLAYDLEAERL